MPDELPGEETGAVATPTTDWEQRYKDTHANWNSLNERMSRFEKDPNALIEFIQEKHPDLLAEDEEETDDEIVEPDETEAPLTRAEFKQWQADQAQAEQARENNARFEADIQRFTGDRTLSKQGEAFVRHTSQQSKSFGPDDLKQTIDDWFTYEDGLKGAGKPKPRAPHVPANGQAATDVPDWSGMTTQQANKFMAEQMLARDQQ